MSEPIRIELASAVEGIDLVESLAVRGLCGELVVNGGRLEVQVRVKHGPPPRWLVAEVVVAVETWLADRRLASIPFSTGGRHYTLRPHLGLEAAGAAVERAAS